MNRLQRSFILIIIMLAFNKNGITQIVNEKDSLECNKISDATIYYYNLGSYDKAMILAKHGLAKSKTVFGEASAHFARSLNNLATLLETQGDYLAAEPLYQEALAICKKVFGENHPDYASSLNNLAGLYVSMGNYKAAEPLYKEALMITKKAFGEMSPHYATSINNLAFLYFTIGNYAAAEPLYKEALNIRKDTLGENNLDYAGSLNNLAMLYGNTGNYKAAESLYEEGIAIYKKILGENHPDYARGISNLASLYESIGSYSLAEPLCKKTLAIRKEVLGESHPDYATSLNNVAGLDSSMGNYINAQSFYEKALLITKMSLGENHPDYAISLSNLAFFYKNMGNYSVSEPLQKEATTVYKKTLGEKHPSYASSLNNLASLYESMGKYAIAETLYKEALNICQEALGKNHLSYAICLNNIAGLYTHMGNYTNAEPLYLEASAIHKQKLGETNSTYAISLQNLAGLYLVMGNFEKAETLYKDALTITEISLGKNHPSYSSCLNDLTNLYYTNNEVYKWTNVIKAALQRENLNLQTLLTSFSETEKETYLNRNENYMQEIFLSMLHYFKPKEISSFYQSTTAKQGWLLQGKQKLINLANNSKDPSVKILLDEWQNINYILTKAIQLTEEKRKLNSINEDSLHKQSQQLEQQLIAALPSLQGLLINTGFSCTQVANKLKSNEVVIHWVSFQYKAPEQWTDSIFYAAYIINPNDTIPKFVTVFEEKQLQQLLKNYHGNSGRSTIKKDSTGFANADIALYNLIWKPLLPYLKNATVFYNLPSGLLHKISFAALTDSSSNKQLIDNYEIHQLLSINELVNPITVSTSAKTITLFGGANYDVTSETVKSVTVTLAPMYRNAKDNADIHFNYLIGTKIEVETIAANAKNTNWKVQTYTNTNASEDNFKNLSGENAPKILHIATHGFYFPPTKTKPTNFITEEKNTPKDFPLLRSGLVLSGVNNYWGKDTLLENKEDGIVTAQEISNLNLLNTDLVVLSACQTALGDINGSEGVYGLQRAFKMAGVKKLLMSLWEVPDAETAELMQLFYTNIFKGETYYTAFRKAQLVLKAKYKDPTKWAGFVLVGE